MPYAEIVAAELIALGPAFLLAAAFALYEVRRLTRLTGAARCALVDSCLPSPPAGSVTT